MKETHHGIRLAVRGIFTLLELLVVVAIIGVLLAILLPALAKAKGTAYQIACSSQLKQMGYAVQNYAIDYNDYLLPEYSHGSWWQSRMIGYFNNNAAIFICPSGRNQVNKEYLATGNNYLYNIRTGNATYASTVGYEFKKFAQIKRPSLKIMLIDGRDCGTSSNYNHFDLGWPTLDLVLRHCDMRHGNALNLLWLDGHVAKENPITENYVVPFPKWDYWGRLTE